MGKAACAAWGPVLKCCTRPRRPLWLWLAACRCWHCSRCRLPPLLSHDTYISDGGAVRQRAGAGKLYLIGTSPLSCCCFAQMAALCGNVLELEDGRGLPVLAMSTRAYNAFTDDQKKVLR